ncbi:hypothetical protein H7J86_32100 [Mycobacterium hackensackense]|nr:hypothetical protein [Mycobacterium hackensackense]
MRVSRIFNGVDRVDVEWTILGQRYRPPTMGLMVIGIVVGIAVAVLTNAWIGLAATVVMAAATIAANWNLNQMDPDGALGETTRLALLWRAARYPYITNTGRH